MAEGPDNWINNPAFQWTPEVPLRAEPKAAAPPEAKVTPLPAPRVEPRAEPRFENPVLREAQAEAPKLDPAAPRAQAARLAVPSPFSLFGARMAVGLAQGAMIFALFANRGALGPMIFSAAILTALFAPLLLLAGLGRMKLGSLVLWTAFAAMLLAAAGFYHYWRTPSSDGGHPGLALLALTSLFLFVGQSIAQGQLDNYPSYHRSAWRLAIRIVICVMFAALAWAAAGAAMGFMREHFPLLQFPALVWPLVALSAALAAQLTGEKLLGALAEGALFVFTSALPFVLLLGIAVAGLGAFRLWQPSLGVAAILAATLIVCINASYRDGVSWRPSWRRRAEFAAAIILVPLALLAVNALAARVAQYGWTSNRVYAVAGLLLLCGHALCYTASALISLGGGSWMQRIEGSNLAMAFAALALIAALASPIADPARLAVATQRRRLEQHKVTADAFDFLWLRDEGLRFGRGALTAMAAMKDQSGISRGAFAALSAPAQMARPTPTEIGANIRVHDGVLPAALLGRDWSGVRNAPPCLTSALLACDAFFTDLDGDGSKEILLAYGSDARWWAGLMKRDAFGSWTVAGTLAAPPCPGSLTALRQGQFSLIRPAGNWRDLLVNGVRLSVDRPSEPSACPN